MRSVKYLPVFFLLLLTGCGASMLSGSAAYTDSMDGILVTSYGSTLYIYDKDQADSGKSECLDACAEKWPPLYVDSAAVLSRDFSRIVRPNGHSQLTFKGKPLYLWSGDRQTGDRAGDGLNNVWHVVPR